MSSFDIDKKNKSTFKNLYYIEFNKILDEYGNKISKIMVRGVIGDFFVQNMDKKIKKYVFNLIKLYIGSSIQEFVSKYHNDIKKAFFEGEIVLNLKDFLKGGGHYI